jgi:hypothetical protein
MGPFLASRVPSGLAVWLCGVAVAASAVSLATLPGDDPAPAPPKIWNQRGCHTTKRAEPPPTIFIGPMTDGGVHRAILQETTRATLATHRPGWNVELTDQPPTIAAKADRGFYLEGTVEDLDTFELQKTAMIRCNVTFWLATNGGKQIAVTTGKASVRTTSDRDDIELSRQACVRSVVEDLIENKLVEVIEHPSLEPLVFDNRW